MDVVQIGERSLTVDDLGRVAAGASVELHAAAVDRISAARAVVDKALAGGLPVYGLNTGVGHQAVRPAFHPGPAFLPGGPSSSRRAS